MSPHRQDRRQRIAVENYSAAFSPTTNGTVGPQSLCRQLLFDFTLASNKLFVDDTIGARDYCPRAAHYGPVPDRLSRNDTTDGSRRTCSKHRGPSRQRRSGAGPRDRVCVGDYDGDGLASIRQRCRRRPSSGATPRRQPHRHRSLPLRRGRRSATAKEQHGRRLLATQDGDRAEDLFVTNIAGETFALLCRRRPRETWTCGRTGTWRSRAAAFHRLPAPSSYDNDGWLKLIFIANGAVNIMMKINFRRTAAAVPHAQSAVSRERRTGQSGRSGSAARSGVRPADVSAATSAISTTTATSTSSLPTTGVLLESCSIAVAGNHWLTVSLDKAFHKSVSHTRSRADWRRARRRPARSGAGQDRQQLLLSASDVRVRIGLG